jgi:hypothetical protein
LLAFFTLQNPAMRITFAVVGLVVALGLLWLIFETVRLRDQLEQAQAERAAQEQLLRQQAAEERQRSQQLSGEIGSERNRRIELEQRVAKVKPSTSTGKANPAMKPIVGKAPAGPLPAASPRPPAVPNPPLVTPPSQTILSLVLTPGLVRDDKPRRLLVPPAADLLRLQLDLKKKGEHQSYRVALRTAEGNELWSQDRPRAKATASGHAVILKLPAKLLAEGDYELTLKGLTASREFEDIGDYYFTIVKK